MKKLIITYDSGGRIQSKETGAVGQSNALFYWIQIVLPEEIVKSIDAAGEEMMLQPLLYIKRPDGKTFVYIPKGDSGEFLLDANACALPGTIEGTVVLQGIYDEYLTSLTSGEEVTSYATSIYPLQPFKIQVDQNTVTSSPDEDQASTDILSVFGPRLLNCEDRVSDLTKVNSNHGARITANEVGIANHEDQLNELKSELANASHNAESLFLEAKEYTETAKVAAIDYADQKVSELLNGAPEAFDTLKELADELINHEDAASAMLTQVASNESKITSLEERAGNSEASIKSLDEQHASLKTRVDAVEGINVDNCGRLNSLEADTAVLAAGHSEHEFRISSNNDRLNAIEASGVDPSFGKELLSKIAGLQDSKAEKSELDAANEAVTSDVEELKDRMLDAETVNATQSADVLNLKAGLTSLETAKKNNTLYTLPSDPSFAKVSLKELAATSADGVVEFAAHYIDLKPKGSTADFTLRLTIPSGGSYNLNFNSSGTVATTSYVQNSCSGSTAEANRYTDQKVTLQSYPSQTIAYGSTATISIPANDCWISLIGGNFSTVSLRDFIGQKYTYSGASISTTNCTSSQSFVITYSHVIHVVKVTFLNYYQVTVFNTNRQILFNGTCSSLYGSNADESSEYIDIAKKGRN